MNKITNKSSLWVLLSDKFSKIGVDNIYNANKNENYGFSRKSRKKYFFEGIIYAISRLIYFFYLKIFRGSYFINYLSYKFLKKNKTLNQYIEFTDELGLDIYNANQIKSFHISKKINFFSKLDNSNIVEIGAGFGGQCISLCVLNNVKKYLIIDLDEMINFSFKMIGDYLKDYNLVDCRAILDNTSIENLLLNNDKTIFFITPDLFIENIELFLNNFEVGINVDSFQEMTLDQVNDYISYMSKLIKPNGIFLNINRKKFLTVENQLNNPLIYPFFGDIIYFDVDEYFYFINKNLYFRPENWYCRVEKKRSSNVQGRII